MFTQNTSNDVVLGKEVPFGVLLTVFYILLHFRKTDILGSNFDLTVFLCR